MRFAAIWSLSILVPVIAGLAVAWQRYRHRPGLDFPQISLLRRAGAVPQAGVMSWLPFLCLSLGAIALSLALARPQLDCGAVYSPSQGLDIMLCLDTSGSMRNTDIEPTRMEAAKKVSAEFVRGRVGDRIGLIVFGGVALMQCPLTVDHVALNHYIDTIAIGMTGVEHTALGDGIAAAVARLSQVEGTGRVIIAVTDGRNNVGEIDPYMAARLAARHGIRLYTIGIGAPLNDGTSAPGAAAGEELDEPCLRELATATSGQYFRAVDSQSLAAVYRQIDSLEKRVVVQELLDYRDIYVWFVLLGVVFIVVGILLENTLCLELP